MNNLKQLREEFERKEKTVTKKNEGFSSFMVDDEDDMPKATKILKKAKLKFTVSNDTLITFDDKVFSDAVDLLDDKGIEGVSEAKDGGIDGMIKALVDAEPSDDNAKQGKFVSLLKGLAFSDDAKATAFMKKLMGAIDDSFVK